MLFEDTLNVELILQGKTGVLTNVVLPFQSIEQVDEPRTDATCGKGQGAQVHVQGRAEQMSAMKKSFDISWDTYTVVISTSSPGEYMRLYRHVTTCSLAAGLRGIIVLLMTLSIVSGCSEDKPVVLGALLTMSTEAGPSQDGLDVRDGMLLAVDELNDRGGIQGSRIELGGAGRALGPGHSPARVLGAGSELLALGYVHYAQPRFPGRRGLGRGAAGTAVRRSHLGGGDHPRPRVGLQVLARYPETGRFPHFPDPQ